MASDIKIRFRSFLPGGGFDSAGAAKQGKTRVVGSIGVTSYTVGGEALAPMDVGLSVIDAITLRIGDETGAPTGKHKRDVLYSVTFPIAVVFDKFYLTKTTAVGNVSEYAAAATETIEFVAEGDSAADVELT